MVNNLGKVCPKCGEYKKISEFYKNKQRSDGISCYCIDCEKLIYREWVSKPGKREEKNRKSKEYYYKNRERINKHRREQRRERMETDSEFRKRELEYRREYDRVNKEKITKVRKKYYKKNKEEIKRKNWERKKRILRKHIKNLGGKCTVCGYDRYEGALDIHHLDPNEKETKYLRFKAEIDYSKVVLVCSNCHREIHGGVTFL